LGSRDLEHRQARQAFYKRNALFLADIIVDGPLMQFRVVQGEDQKVPFCNDGYTVTDFFPAMGFWQMAEYHCSADTGRERRGYRAIETIEDITDRKNAEIALQESEKFLNNVIENIT
jgi:hypothetical protein